MRQRITCLLWLGAVALCGCPEETGSTTSPDAVTNETTADASLDGGPISDGTSDTPQDDGSTAVEVDDASDVSSDTLEDLDGANAEADGVEDIAADISNDAPLDAPSDTAGETTPDATKDTPSETVADAATETTDAGNEVAAEVDSGSDIAQDVDAPIDTCGDGALDPDEACDDANTDDGDYCSADCQTVTGFCGDDIVQTNEACDGDALEGALCSDGATIPECSDTCELDLNNCPPPGLSCAFPADVTGVPYPYTLEGTFTDTPATGFSCNDAPTNTAWFSFTAVADGPHQISITTESPFQHVNAGFAVLEGTGCAPTGSELVCGLPPIFADSFGATVDLVAGNEYLVAYFKNTASFFTTDPAISIEYCGDGSVASGEQCDGADGLCPDGVSPAPCTASCMLDLTGCTAGLGTCQEPLSIGPGSYTFDSSMFTSEYEAASYGGACFQAVGANGPDVTFQVTVQPGETLHLNAIADFNAFLALSRDCADPTECLALANNPDSLSYSNETAETEELFVIVDGFFTDSGEFTLDVIQQTCGDGEITGYEECEPDDVDGALCFDGMTEPTCSPTCALDFSGCPTPGGSTCPAALDITGKLYPYTPPGSFDVEPGPGFSCHPNPQATAWFRYSPPFDGTFDFTATYAGAASSFGANLAILNSCGPDATEQACELGFGSTSVDASAQLFAGQEYRLALFTTGGAPVEDPTIEVEGTPFPSDAGAYCSTPFDLGGQSFPYVLEGQFEAPAPSGFSCQSQPAAVVWFSFTPETSGQYSITATDNAFFSFQVGLVILEGESCVPYGPEATCQTSTSNTLSTNVSLTAGQEYLIGFFATANVFEGVTDPSITISL